MEEEEEKGDVVPIFKKSLLYAERIAVKAGTAEYSYLQIYTAAKMLSTQISNICGSGASLNIAVFCENNAFLPLTQWGCWISGQIFMPLSHTLCYEKLKYFIKNSKAKIIIASSHHEIMAQKFAKLFDIPLIIIDENFIPERNSPITLLEKILFTVGDKVFVEGTLNSDFYTNSDAMLLYTNTDQTSKPKGCIITHKNLQSRIKIISKAWKYNENDIVLNLLPVNYSIHSVHAMMCPLSVGGKVSFCNEHDHHHIWNTILSVNVPKKDRPNILTALPMTYIKMCQQYYKIFCKNLRMSDCIKSYCKQNFRLMISGPLPVPKNIFHHWTKITGHNLIQYYEIQETGSIMINHYITKKQIPIQSNAGLKLPQIHIRLVNSEGKIILTSKGIDPEGIEAGIFEPSSYDTDEPLVGELHISGPSVFKGYFNEDTNSSFKDTFFKTKIIASFEKGVFKILGRNDADIVKKSGRSYSSDDIEILLHTHPDITDVAVVSVSYTLWTEKMCALCVLKAGAKIDLEIMRAYCAKWLPPNMCPDMLRIVPHIKRDAFGKIDKKELTMLHFL